MMGWWGGETQVWDLRRCGNQPLAAWELGKNFRKLGKTVFVQIGRLGKPGVTMLAGAADNSYNKLNFCFCWKNSEFIYRNSEIVCTSYIHTYIHTYWKNVMRGAIRSFRSIYKSLKFEDWASCQLHFVKFVEHDFCPLLVRDVCSMKIWAEAFVNICRILCDYLRVPQVMRPADTPMLLQWSGVLLLLLPI